MEQKLLALLRTSPKGLTAKQIANTLNTDRQLVNRLLYGSLKKECYVDANYVWHVNNQSTQKPQDNANQNQAISADPELKKLCQYYLNCLALDGTNKVISGNNYSKTRIIGDGFNWEWIPFAYGENNLTVMGNCKIKFEWLEPRKVGSM